MTELVMGISGVQEASSKEARGGKAARGKGKMHPRETADDSVDISEEARHRSEDAKHEGDHDHDATAKD